jgi:hypothetical protein
MVLLTLSEMAWAAEGPRVEFESGKDALRITVGGEPLATYVLRDDTILRPYFAHLFAPGKVPVTRRFPPVEGTDPTDHATMHPGLWLAFGDINGVDFWRNKGRVVHEGFVEEPRGGAGQGTFAVRNVYVAGPGQAPECVETCSVTIQADANVAGTLLILDSRFTSDAHDVAFGAQEEMGLGLRVATPMAVKQGGQLLDSEGRAGEKQIWGKHAAWCDASGTVDGRHAGVSLFRYTATFDRGWFHVRDYGLMVANPIQRSDKPRGEPARLIVPRGKVLRLRYGVWLHSGPAPATAPEIESAYRRYLRAIGPPGGPDLQ